MYRSTAPAPRTPRAADRSARPGSPCRPSRASFRAARRNRSDRGYAAIVPTPSDEPVRYTEIRALPRLIAKAPESEEFFLTREEAEECLRRVLEDEPGWEETVVLVRLDLTGPE